jgi:uncharacterized protein CbrC (UPF0167 family)
MSRHPCRRIDRNSLSHNHSLTTSPAVTNIAFHYFTDPVNFAYLRDDDSPCEYCGSTSPRLDGGNLSGTSEIDAVCFSCVERGALIQQDMSTNSVNLEEVRKAIGAEAGEELTNTIIYRTPKLPTWQDTFWPFVDGDFPVFLKLASKGDFADQQQFTDSILPDGISEPDPAWQWDMLPDHPIKNLKDGQYDISIYLFRRNDRLLTIWDAN